MNKVHLSEEEIQQYALGKGNLNTIEHIGSCVSCEAKAANYRLIFSEMDELPQPAFDFDVASLVLAQLPQPETTVAGDERWFYLLIFAALASIGIPVYVYRLYFFKMFKGILPEAMYLVVLIILFILVFQGIEIFRKYQKQLNILNYK
ncbi:hypothetical protein AB6735_17180 [Mucilaginibacter sp. RCC_168]|jgi:hypothetical protein|uniref:hypothetical protein n=1 Tax=unclassified Mucilaginibacter TaxID=2617802 RepID=UPI000887FEA3|nr:hypothetical protein [Mucilaginibacter sp. OK268]SDP10695.1 hypothetical protein SAMN05428975_0327 [Mucilaginibacter sp. OK268]